MFLQWIYNKNFIHTRTHVPVFPRTPSMFLKGKNLPVVFSSRGVKMSRIMNQNCFTLNIPWLRLPEKVWLPLLISYSRSVYFLRLCRKIVFVSEMESDCQLSYTRPFVYESVPCFHGNFRFWQLCLR